MWVHGIFFNQHSKSFLSHQTTGLHDPFRHLKHKLWPKKGLGIKLTIWLPTTKSWESPRFPYFQMTCNIPLKISWRWIQLCFKPHLNRKSTHKVMGPKVAGVPTLGISGLPLGSLRKNDIWMLVPWLGTKYKIRGESWWFSPSLGRGEFCEFVFACGSYVHQNVPIAH